MKQYHALSMNEQIELQEQRDELLDALELMLDCMPTINMHSAEVKNNARLVIAKAKASRK